MSQHLLLLCKDTSDLADMEPLRTALIERGHTVHFAVDARGTMFKDRRVPEYATIVHTAHELTRVPIDGVVASCSEGSAPLLRELDTQLARTSALFFFLPDARKVRFRDIRRQIAGVRQIFLANDSSVPNLGTRLFYTPGLPRYDAMARLTPADRERRRRFARSIPSAVQEDDFVVLFAGQRRETARVFQDVTTALRSLPAVTCDRPISRVLGVFPSEGMAHDERVLWSDVLAMRSWGSPGLTIIDDLCRSKREKIEDEERRARTGGRGVSTELRNASLVDAILAADLVISSTHSALLAAATLGVKALSYYAPQFGQTSYEREITGNPDSWDFLPEPRGCIRQVTTYVALREAIISAIPRRNPDNTLDHARWPEQNISASAPWTQGNNTKSCADAIEDAFHKLK